MTGGIDKTISHETHLSLTKTSITIGELRPYISFHTEQRKYEFLLLSRQNLVNTDQPNLSGNDPQKFTSLVDQLIAVRNSTKGDGDSSRKEIDAMCAKNASEASKKLMTQLKTMKKDGVRDLIKNPKQPHKTKLLNIQAREKLREQMRKKLKKLGDEGDTNDFSFEPDECIDYEKMPGSLIAQISKTIDHNIDNDDMDLTESINEGSIAGSIEDKDIEVVTKNLGNDFLMGSEMLLMNGFSLLAEADESEIDGIPKIPPLPNERPPSPPPQPVPPPSDEMVVQPAFSSVEKPWSSIRNRSAYNSRINNEWDIASARNPDPPNLDTNESVSKTLVDRDNVPEIKLETLLEPEIKLEPLLKPSADSRPTAPVQSVTSTASEAPPAENSRPTAPVLTNTPSEALQPDYHQDAQESGRRANETYGDYRRRLAEERRSKEAEGDESNTNMSQSQSDRDTIGTSSLKGSLKNSTNISENNFNSQSNQRHTNQRNSNDRNFNQAVPSEHNSWVTNRNNKQNNSRQDQHQNRPSRFEMDRGRDQNSNQFQQRNLSRDTNNSHDGRFDDVKDGHNYRFQNEKNSAEPNIERLNSLLHPKPLQFKGSFNKRSQNTGNFNQGGSKWNRARSRSRNRTPLNNSMERDFDENLLPSPNDVRPCLTTLKKVMDIDAELMRIHDKIHGIDKVISNLQSERIAYQKSCTVLQHDRKVLFDNMMKRVMSNTDDNDTPPKENSQSKERPQVSAKSANEKKLQNIVEQKKRKHDEQLDEPKKKKQLAEETTTSAAEKAAKVQKEREEEERRLKVIEKRRLKKVRREREEAERLRLEEKNRQEATAATTIKVEPVEKTKSSKNSQEKASKHKKQKEPTTNLFMRNEILQFGTSKTRQISINVQKVPVPQSFIDTFSSGLVEIDPIDWNKWSSFKEKIEIPDVEKEKPEVRVEVPPGNAIISSHICEDPLEIPDINGDPLALDDTSMNPPTPGSSLTESNEDSMLIEIPTEQDYDYSEWTGNFASHDRPIVHLQTILNKFIVCSTEGGKILKYRIGDGKLAAVFSKHTEICNSFLYDSLGGSIYTVSSDGFLHKIKFKVGVQSLQVNLSLIFTSLRRPFSY